MTQHQWQQQQLAATAAATVFACDAAACYSSSSGSSSGSSGHPSYYSLTKTAADVTMASVGACNLGIAHIRAKTEIRTGVCACVWYANRHIQHKS
jgi:hypothetical protein